MMATTFYFGYEKNVYNALIALFNIFIIVISDLIFICLLCLASNVEHPKFRQRFKCMPVITILLSLSAFNAFLLHAF